MGFNAVTYLMDGLDVNWVWPSRHTSNRMNPQVGLVKRNSYNFDQHDSRKRYRIWHHCEVVSHRMCIDLLPTRGLPEA